MLTADVEEKYFVFTCSQATKCYQAQFQFQYFLTDKHSPIPTQLIPEYFTHLAAQSLFGLSKLLLCLRSLYWLFWACYDLQFSTIFLALDISYVKITLLYLKVRMFYYLSIHAFGSSQFDNLCPRCLSFFAIFSYSSH